MKLFVITSRVPWPLEKGDKLRMYHQLKHLSRQHEIYLFSLTDQTIDAVAKKELSKYCKEVKIFRLNKIFTALRMVRALFSPKPFQVHYFFQRNARNRVYEMIEKVKPDHIFCQLIRTSEYVKHIHTIPKTLDYMDAFNKGVERRKVKSGTILRLLLNEESKRLVAYENLIFEYFENHCIISEQDQQLIVHPNNTMIKVVPNGVDTQYFSSLELEKEFDLLFTGNMGYAPNVDAALFLVKQIMPLVWKKNPKLKVMIAGADPSPRVRNLASERVKVSGFIDDIRQAYAGSILFIAPMQIGTGLQNKLLEAMSMELPCITSDLANNALGATNNQEILIGDSPQSYADLIINLLQDPKKQELLTQNGRSFVVQNFSWQNAVGKLNDILIQSNPDE